jgi:diguanylate cyclase (GGDEF)-like protein
LPDTPADAAVTMANAMCRKVRDLRIPHQAARSNEHIVTISIGVAGTDRCHADEVYDLINAADRALYQAKASGRNRVESL